MGIRDGSSTCPSIHLLVHCSNALKNQSQEARTLNSSQIPHMSGRYSNKITTVYLNHNFSIIMLYTDPEYMGKIQFQASFPAFLYPDKLNDKAYSCQQLSSYLETIHGCPRDPCNTEDCNFFFPSTTKKENIHHNTKRNTSFYQVI